jgi:hypothetical protein
MDTEEALMEGNEDLIHKVGLLEIEEIDDRLGNFFCLFCICQIVL